MAGLHQLTVDVSCIKNENKDHVEEEEQCDSQKMNVIKTEPAEETTTDKLWTEIDIGPIKLEENLYNIEKEVEVETFDKEVRRVKQKKCGQATSDNYTSKWEFFDALNFIQNGDGSNYEIQKLKVHANCLRRHLKSPVNLKIDVKLCETFINAFCNWIRIKASLGVTNRKAFRMPST
ncbi:uncharacterized protein LOC133835276 isoform X3 [Drosophila sulfurigaster albostrigata]|uniref:uncharacterized protein LOC133835276 isoform X3 n=1 Tax=Drosophila sulfurigaster albostrigata TaxID=89887 RepID=UPI002D21C6D6|nr:uncharacterized protein LOC133835276 isoform X3 [Drosophila sulfurigaster albostrigata]